MSCYQQPPPPSSSQQRPEINVVKINVIQKYTTRVIRVVAVQYQFGCQVKLALIVTSLFQGDVYRQLSKRAKEGVISSCVYWHSIMVHWQVQSWILRDIYGTPKLVLTLRKDIKDSRIWNTRQTDIHTHTHQMISDPLQKATLCLNIYYLNHLKCS